MRNLRQLLYFYFFFALVDVLPFFFFAAEKPKVPIRLPSAKYSPWA